MKVVALKFVNRVDGEHVPGAADESHAATVGVSGEASGIFDECADALFAFHFVEHRAFDLTGDLHETLVWLNDDDVARGESNVAFHVSVEDVVIDVAG